MDKEFDFSSENSDRRYRKRSKDDRHRRRSRSRSYSSSYSSSSNQQYKADKDKSSPQKSGDEQQQPIEKEKPCFIPSGILAEYSNKLNGVVLKFTEPIDAAPPALETWGLYPFNGKEALKSVTLRTHDNLTSAFLLGRDPKVAHVNLDHHSCSSEHAVI